MEQPKKPAATRDIADLKARLGLMKPAAAPASAPPPPAAPFAGAPAAAPPAGRAPAPRAAPSGPVPSPFQPAPGPAPIANDPYVAMRPPAGKSFDLRPVDDGVPAESVRAKGGKGGLVVGAVLVVVGLGFGYLTAGTVIARRTFNYTNAGAKKVKVELDNMQKTLTQIGQAVAASQRRLAEAKQDSASYDAPLIDELEKVKLDPRPDTARIFKVDYFRLEDLAVDRLMTYYYDSIALYGEVERHVKKTKADKVSLEAFSSKQVQKGEGKYGVVFDQRGKITIASLVEIGAPICKGGGAECPGDQIEGFQVRANTGANWFPRKVGPKPEGDKLAPLDRTPLLESVMAGSPDQVRMEQYRTRYNNIRMLIARLTAAHKELFEAITKAAGRPDLTTL